MGGTAARYVSGQGVENQLGPGCEDLARRWICFPTLLQRNFLELPDGTLSGLQHAYLAGSPLWKKPNSNCPPPPPPRLRRDGTIGRLSGGLTIGVSIWAEMARGPNLSKIRHALN